MHDDPSDTPRPDAGPLPSRRASGHGRHDGHDEQPEQGRRWVGPAVAVGLAMGAAAICALVLGGMQDNAIYSKPVDALLAQKARFIHRPVRAEGNLVHGSLAKRELPCEYRFTIEKNGAELPVRYPQCIVPDTFRDVPDVDVGVTVEGELQADLTFEATSVLAKCPSKYEMQQRKQRGEQMPHGPLALGPGEPRTGGIGVDRLGALSR